MVAIIFLIITLFIFAIFLISVLLGVPFLPTHRRQAKLMMELAGVGPGTQFVDLGSGAGRLLFLAAERGANAIGYELNPFLYFWTLLMIRLRRYKGTVQVKLGSLYAANLQDADVVSTFLMNGPMRRLGNSLLSQLKPGARLVSYVFPLPNRTPTLAQEGVFVYKI